jgi:hypothetical protein
MLEFGLDCLGVSFSHTFIILSQQFVLYLQVFYPLF